jgi:ribulose-5-phosphate 4-epimerase/fuculose-1-phosphate aldolase
MPDTMMLSPVRARVSAAEWQARLDCAALYRLMALHGWIDLIFNHITLRVPGEEDRILINPYGWMFEEITASSLVTIDLEGNEVYNPHGREVGVNYAGYVIHSAVHGARPDVACVIHTHSRARHGRLVDAMRLPADDPDRDQLLPGGVSRLPRPGGGHGGTRVPGARPG